MRRIDYDFSRLEVDDNLARQPRHPGEDAGRLDIGLSGEEPERHRPASRLRARQKRYSASIRQPGVDWFDVDYPEVIELRRKLYPARDGYHLIASSVTEPGWLDQVPRDRPAMVVAEGLTPYLGVEEGPQLFSRLLAHLAGRRTGVRRL